MNNYYRINFTENQKYHPSTRNIEVMVNDEYHAEMLIHNEFGSLKIDKKSSFPVYAPTDKIKINSIIKIDNFSKPKGKNRDNDHQ